MNWNKLYERAVKCLNWNVIRRTIATTLIFSLLGTQMPLSSAAGIGSSEAGTSGFQTGSNAISSARGASDDVADDERKDILISGTITIMDDGMSDSSVFERLDLRLYVNGTLATDSNFTVKLDKSGSITATASNAEIPLVNDLDSGDADNSSRGNGAQDGFRVWSWYVDSLPEGDTDGVPYEYSIRDMRYHPATASDAGTIDGYTLFYTDEGGQVINTDGGWGAGARNLTYVQKGTIEGVFTNEAGAIPLAMPTHLNPTPDAEEDEAYIGEAYGWIDTGAGSWCITDALTFNPESGTKIVWRGQVAEDALDGKLIRYDNIGEYAGFDDLGGCIYEGGAIVNCSTTCQVTGMISWIDSEDIYGKRPSLGKFTLKVTDMAGQSVPDVVIEIEEGSTPGTWNYTITGLSVNRAYKVKAVVPAGYIAAEEIEFIAAANLRLQKIEMLASTPSSVTIKADVAGLQESENVTLTYTHWADRAEYNGSYNYTAYHADGTMATGTGTGSQISVVPGETVVVELIDTTEGTNVTVTRTTPENPDVLCIKESADAEATLYVFQYSALKSVEACIVWNDNNSARPYDSSDAYLGDGKIHLYFQLGGEGRQYDLSDPDDLSDALNRLGLTEWNGFAAAGDADAAEWYYSAAGLPAYALSAEGTIVEVNYWIEVDDVDGYMTIGEGWNQAPDQARLDSWKFIYSSKTELEIEVLWLDDDLYNGTRPDVDDWKGTVTLHQVSTERSNEIDLTMVGDSFSVTEDGNLWKIEIFDLPGYDEDGYPYTYYLVQGEVAPDSNNDILNNIEGEISYQAENSNAGRYSSSTDACYQGGVIKNTLTGEVKYSAAKIWKDGDRSAARRPTVTLTLWRYTKGDAAEDEHSYAAAAPVYYDMNGGAVTVTLEGDTVSGYYVNVSGNLPAFDKDGHEYIYFVREFLSENDWDQYICEIDNSSEGSVDAFSGQKGYDNGDLIFSGGTFTNRLAGAVTVTGTTAWKAKVLQVMKEATITVELQRKLYTAGDSAWKPVENEEGQVVTKVITGFKAETMTQSFSMGTWDKYDEDANEYEYRVVEIAASLNIGDGEAEADFVYDATGRGTSYKITVNGETYSFSCDVERDRDRNETIVNRLTGETCIEIHKYWNKSAYDANFNDVDKLYFHVYRNGSDICEELGGNHDNGYLVMDISVGGEVEEISGSSYYHWSVCSAETLPKYDKEGAEYIYSIQEEGSELYSGRAEMWYDDKYGTFQYDHYGADIYNGSGKAIPVVKKWLDDGDILHREAVTAGLYNKNGNPEEPERTIILNEKNAWSGFFPIGVGDDADDYVVKEISIGSSEPFNASEVSGTDEIYPYKAGKTYIKTAEHIYQVTEKKEGDGVWVISNLRIGTIDVHLEKQWLAGVMEDPDAYLAGFYLETQDLSEGERIFLRYDPQSKKWEYDSGALPKYDKNGALHKWSLQEVGWGVPDEDDFRHYHPSLSLPEIEYGEYHTGDVYSYTAQNTRSATGGEIKFHKIWKDNNGQDGVSRPDIYLKLYCAVDKNGNGELDTEEYEKAIWLTAQVPKKDTIDDYHWIFSYSSLPLYDDNGFSYIYFAEEGMPALTSDGWKTIYLDSLEELGLWDYERTISLESIRDESYMLEDGIAVNYREGSAFVNGTMVWGNMGNHLLASDYPYDLITITLYSAILDENGDPIFDPEGKPSEVFGEDGSVITTGIKYDSKTGDFTYSFGELPKYDKETGSLIRYYVKGTLGGGADVGGFTGMSDGADFKLTITYDGGQEMTIKISKTWDFGEAADENGTPLNGYPSVYLDLYRKLQKPDGNGAYVDLYPDQEQNVSWCGLYPEVGYVDFRSLPYYGPNGYPYRYYLKEVGSSGYELIVDGEAITSQDVDLGGKLEEGQENEVHIKNRFKGERVAIKGTKEWVGDTGWGLRNSDTGEIQEDVFRPEGIELDLWRRIGTYGTWEKIDDAQIVWEKKDTDTWEFTFEEGSTNFSRYQTNGQEYTYSRITESNTGGYNRYVGEGETDYDDEGVYTYTVTVRNNLRVSSFTAQKEWDDNDNLYGTRPEEVVVKLQRKLENAAESEYKDVLKENDVWTQKLTSDGGWQAEFADLPRNQIIWSDNDSTGYTAELTPYIYRVLETTVPEDYYAPDADDHPYQGDPVNGDKFGYVFVDGGKGIGGGPSTLTFYNVLKATGFLVVTKIQEGGFTKDFTFRVKLNINGEETLYTGAYTVLESESAWNEPGEVRQTDEAGAIVIRRNQQFVIKDLPVGAAYVVTEDPANGFTLVSTENSTGVIPYKDAATASFTNKYTHTGGGGGGTTPTKPGTSGTAPAAPDVEGIPQELLLRVMRDETPSAGLAKTGDTSPPYALLIVIMLGAVGSMTALILKRRKKE